MGWSGASPKIVDERRAFAIGPEKIRVVEYSQELCTMSVDRFPLDANGDVLRRMEANGDHLDIPRDIDFMVATPNEQSAILFAESVRALGYATKIKFPGPVASLPWDVTVVKYM